MEGIIKLGHMDSRENTRKEMLRELLALRPPPTPASFLPPYSCPLQSLQRAEDNTVKIWRLLPRRQGSLLTSWSDLRLW